jgi:hypothetical protein
MVVFEVERRRRHKQNAMLNMLIYLQVTPEISHVIIDF